MSRLPDRSGKAGSSWIAGLTLTRFASILNALVLKTQLSEAWRVIMLGGGGVVTGEGRPQVNIELEVLARDGRFWR